MFNLTIYSLMGVWRNTENKNKLVSPRNIRTLLVYSDVPIFYYYFSPSRFEQFEMFKSSVLHTYLY